MGAACCKAPPTSLQTEGEATLLSSVPPSSWNNTETKAPTSGNTIGSDAICPDAVDVSLPATLAKDGDARGAQQSSPAPDLEDEIDEEMQAQQLAHERLMALASQTSQKLAQTAMALVAERAATKLQATQSEGSWPERTPTPLSAPPLSPLPHPCPRDSKLSSDVRWQGPSWHAQTRPIDGPLPRWRRPPPMPSSTASIGRRVRRSSLPTPCSSSRRQPTELEHLSLRRLSLRRLRLQPQMQRLQPRLMPNGRHACDHSVSHVASTLAYAHAHTRARTRVVLVSWSGRVEVSVRCTLHPVPMYAVLYPCTLCPVPMHAVLYPCTLCCTMHAVLYPCTL